MLLVVQLEVLLTKMDNFKYSRSLQSIFLMSVVCFILVFSSSVSAVEKEYDENTQTVTIIDEFWFINIGDLGKVQLLTPLENYVNDGEDVLVIEYNITGIKDLDDFFYGETKTYNKKKYDRGYRIELEKEFTWRYLEYYEEETPIYDYETLSLGNGTVYFNQIQIGIEYIQKERWIDFDKSVKKVNKGESVRFGLFTSIKQGDDFEFIPYFEGLDIPEWARIISTNGAETIDGDYTVVTFTSNGMFNLSGSNLNASILVVAGGGGGGNPSGTHSGGGGAGGIIFNSSFNIIPGNYNVVVGSGGTSASAGSDSSFSTITATGGGQGGTGSGNGGNGGSGGGAGSGGTGGTGVAGQGFGGSNGGYPAGAGGGGVEAGGTDAGAYGGDGLQNDINGTNIFYAGGGAGFFSGDPLGGDGGGGDVQSSVPYTPGNGTNGLGGGGAGSGGTTQGGWGGDGVVIIRYLSDFIGVDTTLINPENNENVLNNTVTFNFTSTPLETNLTNATLYIWHNNGTLVVTNFTTLSGNESVNTTFINTLEDGMYKWNAETCGEDVNCSFAISNNSFIVHITPVTINIIEPNGTIEYILLGDNETLTWQLTEPGENLTEHVTNCSYTYNSVITYIPLSTCVGTNTTSFEYILGVNELNFNVTDFFNLTSNKTTTWDYKIIEINQTWAEESVESATETYTANVSYNSSIYTIATAILYLNGSSYIGTKTDDGGITTFSADAIIPSVLTQTNFTGYWTISLTDEDDTYDFNLSSTNVTVIPIELALCNGGNNIPFWNFTILNETNNAEVVSNFVATFSVRKEGSSTNNYFNFSDTSSSKSQFDFCITPSEENYTIDTIIQLSKTGYVTKSYNYEEVVVTNATREDNLYMMTNEDSTSFIVHVVYISALDISDAEVRVQRYYPGIDQWVTTEIITTNDVGTAIGHILSEDADYRFQVYKDGVSIHNSSSTKITCTISPCTVTLVVPLDVATGIEEVEDLSSTLTYGSDIFTYTYSDTSGSFSNARLFVIRLAPSNSTIITPCDISKITSSGVLTCDISGFLNGTYQATGYITRSGDEFLDERINGALGDRIYDAMGEDGVLWAIFIFIGIVMLGMKRPSLAIVFGIFGFVILALIQVINIGVISIVAIVTIGIILLVRIGRE